MGRAVALRSDFCGDDLRTLAKQHKDGACRRRLLALSLIYDGEVAARWLVSAVSVCRLCGTGYYVSTPTA